MWFLFCAHTKGNMMVKMLNTVIGWSLCFRSCHFFLSFSILHSPDPGVLFLRWILDPVLSQICLLLRKPLLQNRMPFFSYIQKFIRAFLKIKEKSFSRWQVFNSFPNSHLYHPSIDQLIQNCEKHYVTLKKINARTAFMIHIQSEMISFLDF